ncbi:carbon storage regulator, CsrA [Pseudomonas linyingensis]|uniref:Carbon storage regulator, CsrA n=1 Tax=Pseudomonas linyingensis TaxID=915471 RepID=A0A1H6ZV08_9PSED|nr:carbon storage regulator [Pseudomonas linyingensis]SEJ57313.1 carbon storage regulator, CsrA [Pseudomonas linyingensis]
MPLILGRRVGEKIHLTIDPSADQEEALRRLIADGIEIEVASIKNNNHVRLAIAAPRELLVLREELVAGSNEQYHMDNDGMQCESPCQ